MPRTDVHKLVDMAKFNRHHVLVLFWCILILIFDGYDLAVVGAALPSIMEDMGVDATQAGFMASSALFGMMFGAIILGTLADKIGRRLALSIAIALFSVFTAAAGLAHDPITFSIARFIAGVGIGGALPVVTAQIAEFAPAKIRGRLVTLAFAGYAIGGVLVALTGKQLIEAYGWQSVFFAAFTPMLLIPFIIKTMPESMPFLIKKGRVDELRRTIAKLVPGYSFQQDEQFVVPAEDRVTSAPAAKLFHDGRGLSTVMIWLAFLLSLFTTYALSSWLTKLMAMAGYSLGSALNFVILFNLGAITGSVFGGWLGDKFNIKYVLLAFYAAGAASLTMMGYTRSTELLSLIVFITGASTLGTAILAYAYAGQFYPTAIRSTGVGFASGVGRLGGILGPILIGALVSLELPLEQNFMAIGLASVLGMIAVTFINHKRSASTHHYDAAKEPGLDAAPAATVARTSGAKS